MSDDVVIEEETPTVDVAEPEPQGETADKTDWKAEARKWENRAKASKGDSEDAAKWREYEASLKPAQERMAEELAATRQEAESAKTALLRYEVAAEKGIPPEAVRLLTGSTREELEEAAETLSALIAAQSKPKQPSPDDLQGRPATSQPGQLTHEDLKGMTPSEIEDARKQGRLNDLVRKS